MPQWRIPNSRPWITAADVDATWAWSLDAGIGSQVAAFERELAEFLGRKYVVCVSSGTVALELALLASKAQYDCAEVRALEKMFDGSVVGCGAFGFVATPNAIERAGHRVGFEDKALDCVLGEVPDHTGRTGVRDACQSFGAKLPPSLADCYSFNWNKPITCLGGGCVATDDDVLANHVRCLANQGRLISLPIAVAPGTNARMSDMHAALGRSQLRRVGEILERRQTLADAYRDGMAFLGGCDQPWKNRDSWFLFPIELSNRDEVHAKMLERGIQTRSCADWLLPAHPYYVEKYGYKRGMFPEAERRADRTLLLPLFPEMTLEQVQEVCRALEECDARS